MEMLDFSTRVLAKEALEKVGEEVTLFGWVHTVRAHGNIAFLDLVDRSGLIQVGAFDKELATKLSSLNQQDVVKVLGVVKKRDEKYINPKVSTGTVEIEAKKVEIVSKSETLPFDMGGKDLSLQLPTLLDYRSLTLRHPSVKVIFQVQAAIAEGFRRAAKELDCIEVFVPTIAASSTEGGAEVFRVDYFEHKAFMAQSPQLYKQMLVPVFERVFTIAHAYRAEPSVTTRHLTESTQMDLEFGFVDFETLLNLLEHVAVSTLTYAQKECSDIFKELDLPKIAFGKIPRLTLKEAQEIIYKEFQRDVRGEKDLSPQDEIDISSWALKTHKSDLVTITHFPTAKRAFYTMPDPNDPEISLSYDLLFRGVEILSGSQRIHEYDQLIKTIKNRGMNPKNFELYLQAFKYGMPPEGGFSFGLERITWHVLQLPNIRQASLFPRDMERVDERLSVANQKTSKTQ